VCIALNSYHQDELCFEFVKTPIDKALRLLPKGDKRRSDPEVWEVSETNYLLERMPIDSLVFEEGRTRIQELVWSRLWRRRHRLDSVSALRDIPAGYSIIVEGGLTENYPGVLHSKPRKLTLE